MNSKLKTFKLIYLATVIALLVAPLTWAQDSQKKALEGKVVSVDTEKNEIAIKDDQDNDKTLRVSPTTKLTKGGKEIPLADVKAGDRLRYEFDETTAAGTPTLKSVEVMAAKADKP